MNQVDQLLGLLVNNRDAILVVPLSHKVYRSAFAKLDSAVLDIRGKLIPFRSGYELKPGEKIVPVVVFDDPKSPKLYTNAQKRELVTNALKAPEAKSLTDIEISVRCGVSSMFVGNVRAELALHDPSFASPTRVAVRNGKPYIANVTRIGRKHGNKRTTARHDRARKEGNG